MFGTHATGRPLLRRLWAAAAEGREEIVVTSNDQVLLETLLEQTKDEVAPELSSQEYFHLYVVEQLLKDRDPSRAELEAGIVDGGGDGGVDALYTFVNGILVTTRHDAVASSTDTTIELVIVQSKYSGSFSESGIDRLIASMGDLLDLTVSLDELRTVYNADLLDAINVFRYVYIGATTKFPSLKLSFYYATRGVRIDPKVERKAKKLEELIKSLFSSAIFSFTFLGAGDILALARRQQPAALELRLAENPISTRGAGFIALIRLSDYFDFIRDPNGQLRRVLFESNVRDYEGETSINLAIRETLLSYHDVNSDDFWWLNNGITVVASRATLASKSLTLENPQVVNGLQTSFEIFTYFDKKKNPATGDDRTVLVRIVVPTNEASRDRIIRATNSQTPIPGVALRATDKIQRDIEEYFRSQGYYYERRKNEYRNLSRPLSRIFTIPYLAEAVLAAILYEPHFGSPRLGGRFLREDALYRRIFDSSYPLAAYLQSALLVRRVQESRQAMGRRRRKGKPLVLLTASVLSAMKTGGTNVSPTLLGQQDFSMLPSEEVEAAMTAAADGMDWTVPREMLSPPSISRILSILGSSSPQEKSS
jgi:hypothetical protein